MLTTNNRAQFWKYILAPALVSASIGVLMGLCGTIATLAPTLEMAIVTMTVFGLIGLVTGGLIGGIALAVRAPAFLPLLGSTYAFLVGLFMIGVIDNLRTNGRYMRTDLLEDAFFFSKMILTAVIAGSVPNMVWFSYKQVKTFMSKH